MFLRSCSSGKGCVMPRKYICTPRSTWYARRDNNKFLQCKSLKFHKSRFVAWDGLLLAFVCVIFSLSDAFFRFYEMKNWTANFSGGKGFYFRVTIAGVLWQLRQMCCEVWGGMDSRFRARSGDCCDAVMKLICWWCALSHFMTPLRTCSGICSPFVGVLSLITQWAFHDFNLTALKHVSLSKSTSKLVHAD